jgi:hypothetical protein
MQTAGRRTVLAILSVGLGACGSSGGSPPPNVSTPDASQSASSCADSGPDSACGAEPMADAQAPNADASSAIVDAGAGPNGPVGDAAALDSGRDSQGSDGPSMDGGPLDGSTFACGSSNPATCVAGAEYCMISPSNHGELPVPVNSCEALAALPCFSTSVGCHCSDLPLDADASGCRCLESDASSALTIDCF